MKKLFSKRLFLTIAPVAAMGVFVLAAGVLAYEVGTDFTLCTASVSQPACYGGAYPTPTVNWTVSGASSQTQYQVQFDQNSNFNNIDIDSGVVTSASHSYQVASAGLNFGQVIYWRVKIKDNFGSWITSWVEGDSFTVSDSCGVPPTVTSPLVSAGSPATYCATAAHYFSWTYTSPINKKEDAFYFQVDNNSDFSSPAVNRSYTGLNNDSPTVNNQTVVVAETPGADQIGYNTTYYWRANVVDKQGSESGWVSGPSFTTESHRYPTINFNWSPVSPSRGEDVLFADQSTVYGGATKSAWSWVFQSGNPVSSVLQNPIVKFISNGAKTVTLQVTDSNGFSCSGTGPGSVSVGFSLPDWREILPF